MEMKNQLILLIALIILILACISSAYAEDNLNPSLEQNMNPNQTNSSKETIISGTVRDCITKDPFPAVNITVSNNENLVASNLTKDDGSYVIHFLSNYIDFNVTASHMGHNSVTKEINASSEIGSAQFGNLDFELGTTYPQAYVNGKIGNDEWYGNYPTYQGGKNGPKATIQAGIDVTQPGGILFIANDIYTISNELTIDNNILIYGEERDSTIVDGNKKTRILKIDSNKIIATISNLTIRNGKAPNGDKKGDAGHDGGGIYNTGSLTIDNCKFYSNFAGNGHDGSDAHSGAHGGYGGAIYNEGTLTITNSYFTSNSAGNGGDASRYHDAGDGGNGGAIYNQGSLTISSSEISNNTAGNGGNTYWQSDSYVQNGGDGGDGGGIYNTGTFNIIGNSMHYVQIHDNTGGKGGNSGIHLTGGSGGNAGGIYNNGICNIQYANIYDNKGGIGASGYSIHYYDITGGNGGNGGALYNDAKGTLNITESNLTNNNAGNGASGWSGNLDENCQDGGGNGGNGGNGGAIANIGTLLINNCQISGNKAGQGGVGAQSDENEHSINGGSGGSGGGIYTTSNLNIEGTTIDQNSAGNGGKGGTGRTIQIQQGMVEHVNPGNGGNAGSGGGIYFYNNANGNNHPLLRIGIYNSTISNDTSGHGGNGGDNYPYPSSSNPSNGGNGGNGGGIALVAPNYLYALYLFVRESTITNNSAGTGGTGNYGKNGLNGVGGALYSGENHYFDIALCHIWNNFVNNTSPQAFYLNLDNSNPGGLIGLEDNWWGTNNYNNELKNQIVGNNIKSDYYSPWLVLSINAFPNELYSTQTSNILATLIKNSNGDNTIIAGWVPDGIPISFAANSGSINPQNGTTSFGAAMTVFTPNVASGNAMVFATADNQTVNTTIKILPNVYIYITKTLDNSRPNVGDNVTFTVTVRNNGTEDATNIQITDKMPGGFSNQVISPSVGTYNNTSGVWTIPALSIGATATLTMNGTVTATIAGMNVTNTAVKTHVDQYDPNPNVQVSVTIYIPECDVQISKNVDNNRPNVGDGVTFKVIVKNNGPDNASNIQISDPMPGGIDIISITPSTGTYNHTSRIWTIPALLNGANATLTMMGNVTRTIAGKNTTNTANITHEDQYDPNSNNSAAASIYVPLADTYISKTISKNNPTVGERISFIVTVINDGPDNATNIQITDFMPAGFDDVQIIPSNGTYNNFTGVWSISLLKYGESAFLNLSGIINSSIAGQIVTNIANITSQDQYDSSPYKTASASINVQEADIEITKTADKSTANVGENVIFTITAKNKGPSTATGLIFIDKLPLGLKFNVASADKYISLDNIGNYILWNLGSLNNDENATLTINTTVISPGYLSNIVRKMHEDQYDQDIDFANVTVYAPQADLILTKTVNNSRPNVGDNITFTVKIQNNGPDNATNIQITDIMPNGFNNISFTNTTGNYEPISGIWTIPILFNGTNATLTLSGKVNSTIAGKNVTNTANITKHDQYDPNPNDNSASASIYVPIADLNAAKTVDKNKPNVGDRITFTVTISNDGPDNASNIQVNDTMPYGFNNVTVTPSTGTSYLNGIWTIPLLLNGANATLTLSGIVNSSIAGQLVTNTANITHEDQYDPTPDDDDASASINSQEADVSITKIADKKRVNVGENVTFTIIVKNNGPDTATGLFFLDKLPAGLQLNAAVADKGNITLLGNNVNWNLGNLTNGENAKLTINTTVISPNSLINIVRKIHEDQYDPDTDFAMAAVYVLEADVSLTNTPNNSTLNVGDSAIFTVIAHNYGPNKATNVILTDVIPQGFTAQVTKGTINNGIWNIGTLDRNEEAILTLSGVISPQWAGKSIYNNISESQNEYNCYPQALSTSIYVPLANVTISKAARNINYNLNETIRYLIILDNKGPDTATGIMVIDQSSDDLEFVSASDNGTYDSISETITWNPTDLSYGLYKVLVLYEKVKSSISNNLITNTATESQNEYSFEAKSSSETIIINKADLYIYGSVEKSNIQLGDTFTITFKLGNKGPNTAENVVVTIPIPDGLEYVAVNADQGTWNYDPSKRTLKWDLGDVFIGDPKLDMILKAVNLGNFIIIPMITTTTYDPNLNSSIIPLNIKIVPVNNLMQAANTISMQNTGTPVNYLIIDILMVLCSFVILKRR